MNKYYHSIAQQLFHNKHNIAELHSYLLSHPEMAFNADGDVFALDDTQTFRFKDSSSIVFIDDHNAYYCNI